MKAFTFFFIIIFLTFTNNLSAQKKDIEKQIKRATKDVENAIDYIDQLKNNISQALEALYIDDSKLYIGYAKQNLEDIIAYNKYLYDDISDLIQLVDEEVCVDMEIAAGKVLDDTYLVRDKTFQMSDNLDIAFQKYTIEDMQPYLSSVEIDLEDLIRFLDEARERVEGLNETLKKCKFE